MWAIEDVHETMVVHARLVALRRKSPMQSKRLSPGAAAMLLMPALASAEIREMAGGKYAGSQPRGSRNFVWLAPYDVAREMQPI
jgi:hypothetical protein